MGYSYCGIPIIVNAALNDGDVYLVTDKAMQQIQCGSKHTQDRFIEKLRHQSERMVTKCTVKPDQKR